MVYHLLTLLITQKDLLIMSSKSKANSTFSIFATTIQLRKRKSGVVQRLANLQANNRSEDGFVNHYFDNWKSTVLFKEEKQFNKQQNQIRSHIVDVIEYEAGVHNIASLQVEHNSALISSKFFDIKASNGNGTRRKKLQTACEHSFSAIRDVCHSFLFLKQNGKHPFKQNQIEVIEDVHTNPYDYLVNTIKVEVRLSEFSSDELNKDIHKSIIKSQKLKDKIINMIAQNGSPTLVILTDSLSVYFSYAHVGAYTVLEYNKRITDEAKKALEKSKALQANTEKLKQVLKGFDTPRKLLTHLFSLQGYSLLNAQNTTTTDVNGKDKFQYLLSKSQLKDIQEKHLFYLVMQEKTPRYYEPKCVFNYESNTMEYHFKIVWNESTTLDKFNDYCDSLSSVSEALQTIRRLAVKNKQLQNVNVVLSIQMDNMMVSLINKDVATM